MILAALVVVLGAIGTYLLLPHKHGADPPAGVHGAGAVAAGLGLLLFILFWSPPGPFLTTVFLYVFGATAIAGAVLTVTSRDPVHSALWFASVVLSTSGLFLLAGAPFLAAGTVIVYAGAIIVTFLFVIMLAQMEGQADYDRAARSPGWATLTSFVIFWCLIYSVAAIRPGDPVGKGIPDNARNRLWREQVLQRSRNLPTVIGAQTSPIDRRSPRRRSRRCRRRRSRSRPPRTASSRSRRSRVARPNVAGLGASLYTDHLVTVGLAGALLFVALVGAVAITNPRRPIRPGTDPGQVAAVGSIRP